MRVYTKLPCVTLQLNNRSVTQDCQPVGRDQKYTATFSVNFEPGSLVALGHAADMGVVATAVLITHDQPIRLLLKADCVEIRASRDELIYVAVEVVDDAGRLVACYDDPPPLRSREDVSLLMSYPCKPPTVFFSVEGPGTLEAVGSADPWDTASFNARQRKMYRGRALAILRPGAVGVPAIAGVLRLNASAEGLISASMIVRIVDHPNPRPI